MISRENYELAKPILSYLVKERGLELLDSRNDWDTFLGWKNRGRSILHGSEGFRVDIVVPYLKGKTGNKSNIGFATRKKILFSREQTI